MNPFATHLDSVIAIARRAGEAILYHYAKEDGASQTKRDGSPVTEADRASEAVILFALNALTPEIPVLSEEEVASGKIPDLSGGVYWCVDPLDGTKEFINRSGEFTVSIGGVMNGYPVFGVLHAPLLRLTFGSDQTGAWRFDEAGGRHNISARRLPDTGRTALISRSHRDREDLDALLIERGMTEHKIMGSAIKFGLIAAGEADLYARFGPTHEWDTAAGQAILEAAGGHVTNLDGRRLPCTIPGFRNPGFIATGA